MAPPLDLNNPNHITAIIVVSTEIILFIILLLARYNARRLKIHQHHKYVYSAVLVNSIVILTWMLPTELRLVNNILAGRLDPLNVWYVLIHGIFGIIAITLGIFLCIVFLIRVLNKDLIPLPLIKRLKPIMITTIICWTFAFLFGLLIFVNKYLVSIF